MATDPTHGMATRTAAVDYDLVYDAVRKPFRVVVAQQPPARRLLAWHQYSDDTHFDLPIPWVYTYIKFARNRARGWQVFDARVFFSPREVDIFETHVSQSYVGNTSADGHVCWGNHFKYGVSNRIADSVPYVLNAFWARTFNAELGLNGMYYAALHSEYIRAHKSYEEQFARLEKLSLKEVLAVKFRPEIKMSDYCWFPDLHVGREHPNTFMNPRGYGTLPRRRAR